MTTKTKTNTKAAGAKMESNFNLDELAVEAKEAAHRIDMLDGKLVSVGLQQMNAHKALGNLLQRAKRQWQQAGKPVKMPEVYKALGVTAQRWSRYIQFAEWCDANEKKLAAMKSDDDRYQAMLAKLKEVRGNKDKPNSDKAKAQRGNTEANFTAREKLSKAEREAKLKALALTMVSDVKRTLKVDIDEGTSASLQAQFLTKLLAASELK